MAEWSDLRQNISDAVSNVYESNPEISSTLDQVFSDTDRDAWEECEDEFPVSDCLEDLAEDLNIGSKFRQRWRSIDPDIKQEIKNAAEDQWSDDQRERARQIASGANLSNLYRACSTGDTDTLDDELGESNFSSTRECKERVAEVGELRSTLQGVWGTA